MPGDVIPTKAYDPVKKIQVDVWFPSYFQKD